MASKIKNFVTEQAQALAEQAQKLRTQPVEAAREAAVKSAQRISAMRTAVRAMARSGVKLTAISQGTAQKLIELQEEIITSALTEASMQLERAARMDNVRDLLRDQSDVLRATRDRIVSDITQAVAIFKNAGGDLRKVATQTYSGVTSKAAPKAKKAPAKRKAKRARRKAKTA
jgi:phasin family protein